MADRLRQWLLAAVAERPLFLRFMAENALRCQAPLGRIRDFVYDRSKEFRHTLDLKACGARLFSDVARIVALAGGVPQTSTAQRLRAAADVGSFGTNSLPAVLDGFHFIQRLRLRNQCDLQRRRTWVNRVDPDELNELDRTVLKEAFRQARGLQQGLALRYGVGSWQ
jgi:CBS domain-containing protein